MQGITQHVIADNQKYEEYKVCSLPHYSLNSSNEFFDTYWQNQIFNQIYTVLNEEAPISQSLLSKRILAAWGITRLGVRLNDYLESQYNYLELKQTSQNGVIFYWLQEQVPNAYQTFRIPRNDEEKRNAEDLPKEEIAAAIVEILKNQISLPADDLIKETARLFGYARLGGNVEQAMKMGIEFALAANMITQSNDRLVLP